MSDVELSDLFRAPGEEDPAPGKDAVLRDGDRLWRIEAGTVELFAVERSDGRPAARWTSLATLGEGALVGGVAAREDRALMIRPSADAQLRPLAADDDALTDAAQAWLEQLLSGLRSRLRPDEAHPLCEPQRRGELDIVDLSPDAPTALDAGAIAWIGEGVAWLSVEQGDVRLLGRERSVGLGAGALAPIGDGDWILAESDAHVAVFPTATVVRQRALAAGLAELGGELLDISVRRVAGSEAGERRLLEEREELDHRALDIAVEDFAAIMDARVSRLRGMGDSPAFAAARLIGEHLGVHVRGPAPSARSGSRTDIVSAIAHASRLRTRRIELSGRWWRRDLGPLMGFTDEDETPVALIPHRRGYVVYEPGSSTATRVNRRTAKGIGAEAREFYRPLPDRGVTRRDLLGFGLAGSGRDIATLTLSAVAFATLGLLVPILTGTILGTLVPRAEHAVIAQLCALLLLAASVSTLFATAFNISGLRLEGRLDKQFQAGVWDRLLALSPRFFREFSTGELATATLGISEAREVLSGMFFKAVLACVVALANLALIAFYDLRLALLTLVVAGIGVGVTVAVGVRQARHQVRVFDATKQVNSRTYQIISGVAKVSTAAAETRALAHWAEAFARARSHIFAARAGQNGLAAFNAGYTLVAAAAAYFVVGDVLGGVDQSTFLIFNIAFFQVLVQLLAVSSIAMLIIQAGPPLRSLRPILHAVPEARGGQVDPGPLTGRFELRDVTFSYAEAGVPAVDGVSLSVRAGEFVAIVGASGCGKSTLLRLMLAFEHPQSGSVTYDGQNLLDLDPVAVRRQCGVVLQDATLFAGDILSNIVGSGLYTYDDAWAALEMTGMDAEVGEMPMGMYTMLSDGGGTLSGGQRQRLLIARALVTRPRLLFLDEATSALDNRSQETVTESMRRLNATRVVIAHRLSTIRGADRILVMDAGRIVQEGTYDELMEAEGLFRTLATRQLT